MLHLRVMEDVIGNTTSFQSVTDFVAHVRGISNVVSNAAGAVLL
jgi:hypothetical protein